MGAQVFKRRPNFEIDLATAKSAGEKVGVVFGGHFHFVLHHQMTFDGVSDGLLESGEGGLDIERTANADGGAMLG